MANVYNRGKLLMLNIDWDSPGTFKAILLDSDFAYNVDHNTLDQISTDRVGTDQTLSGIGITEDDTNNIAYIDATDPTWTAVGTGPTITGCVIYREVGAESADELFCFVDVTNTPANGGDITIQFAADGFAKLTD